MMPTRRYRTPAAWLWIVLTLAVPAVSSTALHAAEGPYVSLRYAGGPEVEVHLGQVGLMYTLIPDRIEETVTFNGVPVCKALYDSTYVGLRMFIEGPRDSWYLGATQVTNTETTGSGGCATVVAETEVLPILGYHWLWDSGFNLDLGLRPGILAVGVSF